MKKILVGLAAVALCAADLSAQVCNGTAPFSVGSTRVGAGVRMPDGATVWDGEFAVSSATGLYGGANIALIDPENAAADGSTVFGGFIGKTMFVDAKKTVEMCPQGFLQFGENSTNAFGVGVSFGRVFKQTSFDVVPFGNAMLSRDDYGLTDDVNITLQLGAGFVLNKKWTVRPYLTLPLTDFGPLTNGNDTAFGVMGYLNLGGK
jgi:NAD-dependent dihydropyrimidine dehydrogenase PreA subunit